MQPWHYYVAFGICMILGNLLFVLARKADGFEKRGKLGKLGVQFFCYLVPTVFIMGPYMAWTLTGFRPADARAAERTMVQSYLAQGAQGAEVHFVVSGHSTMTGFANVTLADGSAVTTRCKGDKATDGGEYLVFCE